MKEIMYNIITTGSVIVVIQLNETRINVNYQCFGETSVSSFGLAQVLQTRQ